MDQTTPKSMSEKTPRLDISTIAPIAMSPAASHVRVRSCLSASLLVMSDASSAGPSRFSETTYFGSASDEPRRGMTRAITM
jgi:hypothetical protein